MEKTAVLLVDDVLPHKPIRQGYGQAINSDTDENQLYNKLLFV
jgi:hypothetical protein